MPEGQPRPVTDVEREMVETALRIVADIRRLDELTDTTPRPRIECTTAARRAAESLYVRAEDLAIRTGDPALRELLAGTPRPEG